MIRTYARDPDLTLAGEIRGWTRIEVTVRYREVGSWTMTGPAKGQIARLLHPGCGLVIQDSRGVPLLSPNGVVISGDVEDIGPRVWAADGADAAPGTLTLVGGDDLAAVADELAYPDPTTGVAGQGTHTYDYRTGAAESVIKAFVGLNVGTARAAARGDSAVPAARLVTIAPDQGRGSTVSHKAQWDPLMEVVRTLSQASTPKLGARVVQTGTDLVFDVYVPADRSTTVVFSKKRRNLRGYSITRSAPTATHVVVAGSGTGASRAFVERADIAAAQEWRRVIRKFVDQRQTNTLSELQAAGDEELARSRRSGALSATAVDTPRCRFGQHFGLGDWVTVEDEDGVAYIDQVTAAKLTVDDKGLHPWEITIGDPNQDPHAPEIYARVAQLEAALSALQRRY